MASGAPPTGADETAPEEPQFLATRRQRAAALVDSLELPQFKGRPGWEFTDLSDLDLSAYRPAEGTNGSATAPRERLLAPIDAIELAQLDAGAGARVDQPLPEGVVVSSLEQAACDHPDLIEKYLGAIVGSQQDIFVARNEAGFRGGAFVFVPRAVALERPILLTAIQAAADTELNRRTLVVLEEGAQAEVWEQQLSASPDGSSLLNTVIELVVGDGARLRFVCG